MKLLTWPLRGMYDNASKRVVNNQHNESIRILNPRVDSITNDRIQICNRIWSRS